MSLCTLTSCSLTQEKPPNVLLISVDTLRPDHLSSYGYERSTSPTIDRLAAEGVLFEQHVSSTSWTLPAHAAMFTSLVDTVHGCFETDRVLAHDRVTLAEHFSEAGYQTAGFFAGPYLHPAFGLGQGFEVYEDCTSYGQALAELPTEAWSMDRAVMQASHRDVTNPTVYDRVSAWLGGRSDDPFFLFVHLWDAHFDFMPPPPYDTMFDPDYDGEVTGRDFFFDSSINAAMPERDLHHLIALYDGEIAWTDHHIGLILADLERQGVLDDTIVAVTSDHGTEFFEHGGKAHRMTLFDEVIRIPLILRYPPRLDPGLRVARQTRMIDLAPTLLDLAGLPPARQAMGHSLAAASSGEEPLALSELFSVGRRLRAIRTSETKLIHDSNRHSQFYFDLADDPGERQPLDDWTSPRGAGLDERFGRTVASVEALAGAMADPGAPVELPPEVLRKLESLGYVPRSD